MLAIVSGTEMLFYTTELKVTNEEGFGNFTFCISWCHEIIALVVGRQLAATKGFRSKRMVSHVSVAVYVLDVVDFDIHTWFCSAQACADD